MGSKSSPTPQSVSSVPQAPSYGQQLSDYIANYPKLYQLEQEYSPKEAELQLSLLREYGPQYDAYLKAQQEALYPQTAGLQEQLATLASQGMGAELPTALKSQYLDNLRAELGTNAGSGVGADYVSRNLINLGEQYKQHYQDLGLSLLSRQPVQSAMSSVPYSNPTGGLSNALNYGASTYGSYVNALTNNPYYWPSQSSSGMGGMLGGLGAAAGLGLGAMFAAPTGGMSMLAGAGLGGAIGGSAGYGIGSMWG